MDLSSCCKHQVYITETETTICSKCGDECGIVNPENLMEDR